MSACSTCRNGAFACHLCNLRFCGAQCWDASGHETRCAFIGTQAELVRELNHRLSITQGKPITQIVGPYVYGRYTYGERTFLLFGEQHLRDVSRVVVDKLDMILSSGLSFFGTNPSVISVARLFYAIASASNRRERKTDFFFENRYFSWKTQQRRSSVFEGGETLRTLENLAHHMKCIELDTSRESLCDVYPWCKFHLGDFRMSGEVGTYMDLHTVFFRILLEGHLYHGYRRISNDTYRTLIQRVCQSIETFISDIGKDWEKKWFTLAVESDDFSQDVSDWIGSPATRLISAIEELDSHGVLAGLVKGFKTAAFGHIGQRVHPLRSEYKKLALVDPQMAALVLIFGQMEFEAYLARGAMSWVGRVTTIVDNSALTMATRQHPTTIYMDIPLLCRLFRYKGTFSIVYTGSAHTRTYKAFFDWLRKRNIPITVVHETAFGLMRAVDHKATEQNSSVKLDTPDEIDFINGLTQ